MTLEFDRFRGIPLFRGLPDSELTPLLALFQPVTAATGSTLFSAGEPATQIYLLLAGTVSLEQEGEHLYKLRAPTLIGELGGIAGLRRKCRAIVGEGAELVAVAPAALERLLAEHPVLGLRFQHELLEIAADKIQRDQLRLEEMRKNLVRTQKEMKKLRDYVLESDDTVVSAAVHDCLEGLIRQNRRVNYRVEPPPALAATVTGDDGVRGAGGGGGGGPPGRPLLMFNPNVGDRALFEDLIRRAQREALLRGAILYVGPMTLDFLADAGLNFAAAMSNYPGAAVLGVQTMQPPRLKLDHPVQEVELKLPTEPVRLELWQRAVPNPSPDVDLPKLARGFHMTPGEIADIAREANLIANNEDGRLVGHGDLRAGVERRLRNELGEMARKINVAPKWSDLVLSDEDMQRIKEFISRKLYADKVYNDWGFGDRIGYGRGIIALLSGPPGTGKTMLAGLIAKDLDLELYQVDLSIVVSKWIGETEKQLGKVFDQAERAHAVLLFDEADALFAKRTEVTTANDRYGNLAVNYLLQRLEQYTGIAVLTTNKEAVVDEALQRRLSLHLHMRVPEQPERERLWHSFLPDKAPRADDLDFSALSQDYELSGGYIKNAMVRAAFLSVSQDQPIGMDNLRRAAILELEDMGRLAMRLDPSVGGDKGSASSLTGDTVDFSEG